MSGLELLFLDGGATVTSVAAAALGALGYKQRKRDDLELADVGELEALSEALDTAHGALAAQHKELTDAWRGPLSLFGARDAKAATARGVPAWAVASVYKGQRLADKAVELSDIGDIYELQLAIAVKEGKKGTGLVEAPLRSLIARLGDLARQLEVHVPVMQLARSAFDSPAEAVLDAEGAEGPRPQPPAASGAAPEAEELPVRILRDRGRLGELWRRQGQGMARLLARLRLSNRAEADALLPPEVQRKLQELRSEDQYTSLAAVWALGRLGGAAAEEEGPECREAVHSAAVEALRGALMGDRSSPHAAVRKAAVEALGQIGGPVAASALCAVLRSPEEDPACQRLAASALAYLCGGQVGARLVAALDGEGGEEGLTQALAEAEERCAALSQAAEVESVAPVEPLGPSTQAAAAS